MKTKEQKQLEAMERQDRYNKLTSEQKLQKLNDGKFVAAKERARNCFPALESET